MNVYSCIIYLFIYVLINNALSSLDCIGWSDRIGKYWIEKDVKGNSLQKEAGVPTDGQRSCGWNFVKQTTNEAKLVVTDVQCWNRRIII